MKGMIILIFCFMLNWEFKILFFKHKHGNLVVMALFHLYPGVLSTSRVRRDNEGVYVE